ncbi:MAG TPA: sterol desaturase family protein [Thermoleophilaceae bacterium]|jgi:sterol desaturase/sphingolipid hydroxylase (fatty acid hydroxylase superfamily)
MATRTRTGPVAEPPAAHLGEASRTDVLRASPPMFESELLNWLSRVHPAVPVVIFVPGITVLLVLSAGRLPAWEILALAVGGYAFWTLTEYWIHRAIFHFEPKEGIGARLHWIIHGVHHDHPNDPLRLVMPPSVSVPLSALFFLGFWAVIGSPHHLPFGAGFWAGYLIYDMTHYHLHHHKPRTRLGRRLRELHMRHHFQDHTRGFGISAPYWDRFFRTFPHAGDRRR